MIELSEIAILVASITLVVLVALRYLDYRFKQMKKQNELLYKQLKKHKNKDKSSESYLVS